jgi:hypothetical protein
VHKTTYAPMIYTALCIMFWMRAYPLLGQVGGGWALEFSSFLGPVKWHLELIGECHFGPDSRVFGPQMALAYQLDAISQGRVVDPYSFFTDPDPDPVDPDGGQYGSGYGSGSGSNPYPGL